MKWKPGLHIGITLRIVGAGMIRIEFSGLVYPRYYIRLVGDNLEPCRNLIQVTRMGIHIYVYREIERERERENLGCC